MSKDRPDPERVLAEFALGDVPLTGVSLVPLSGGLSGSGVWKVEYSETSYCLKNMPLGFSVNRLRHIHHAAHVRRELGLDFLAWYVPTNAGETAVQWKDRLWELQTWLPGEPPQGTIGRSQKRSMLMAIAKFQQIVRGTKHDAGHIGPSPGLAARLTRLERWRCRSADEVSAAIGRFGMPHLVPLFHQFLDSFQRHQHCLRQKLLASAEKPFPLTDCLGDPRPENFLFAGERLTGLIDLTSLRTDNWALDIARLGGELGDATAADTEPDWDNIFESVGQLAPLTEDEQALVWVLDAANILLTGLNWIEWLVLERRTFSDLRLVESRLRHLERRLQHVGEHPAWKR